MNSLEKYHSDKDNLLISEIIDLINNSHHDKAIDIIKDRISNIGDNPTKKEIFLKTELTGFLIDIGNEGRNEIAADLGLKLLLELKEKIKGLIKWSSYEYNLANAYSNLFKFDRKKSEFKYRPKHIDNLIKCKTHYWIAYKLEIDDDQNFIPDYVVNLANSLSSCGRISESLHYYDLVIEKYPNHPNANASRSKELFWLIKLSGSYSKTLVYQSIQGYEKAVKFATNNNPKFLVMEWKKEAKRLRKHFNIEGDIDSDYEETQQEFESLSEYRKYCITKRLTLSEHALYCNCIGARRDDLLICYPFKSFSAEFIPTMEKILNRIKSEFSISRLLYYYGNQNKENIFDKNDNEVMFSELLESEYINTKSELLRTSFRLCFGILDKIAYAICKLFDLSDQEEKIYFESFWNPRGRLKEGSKKQKRWDNINDIDNISLLALYTQSTDLNIKKGEWGFLKDWRNALEHNFLIIKNDDYEEDDPFMIYKNNPDFIIVDKQYFINKGFQMLQFTRSAIFNFVFMVRKEAHKHNSEDDNQYITHTIQYKNDTEL